VADVLSDFAVEITGTGSVEIRVACPDWFRGQPQKISVVSPQAETPVVELISKPSSQTLRIKLSSVEYYAGIVIEKDVQRGLK
jgi:hypothetical protein